MQDIQFRAGVIQPIECIKEGWQLVRKDYWLMVCIAAGGILLGSVAPLGVLIAPMMCGIYMCLFALMRGEPVEFGILFKGFDHFIPGLIATLIQIVPVMVLLIPMYLLMFAGIIAGIGFGAGRHGHALPALGIMLALFAAGVLLVAMLIVLMGLLFTFTYPLIVDRKLSGVEACKTSARAGIANAGGLIGLMILSTLMSFAGILACYVGAFLVMPISLAAIAVAYRRVFPDAFALGGPVSGTA